MGERDLPIYFEDIPNGFEPLCFDFQLLPGSELKIYGVYGGQYSYLLDEHFTKHYWIILRWPCAPVGRPYHFMQMCYYFIKRKPSLLPLQVLAAESFYKNKHPYKDNYTNLCRDIITQFNKDNGVGDGMVDPCRMPRGGVILTEGHKTFEEEVSFFDTPRMGWPFFNAERKQWAVQTLLDGAFRIADARQKQSVFGVINK